MTNAPASPPAGRKTELLGWLSEEGRFAPDIGRLLEALCEKLTALGVPRDIVVEDYLLSNQYMLSPDAIDAYFRERTFCSTAEAARHRQRSAWAAD